LLLRGIGSGPGPSSPPSCFLSWHGDSANCSSAPGAAVIRTYHRFTMQTKLDIEHRGLLMLAQSSLTNICSFADLKNKPPSSVNLKPDLRS